MVWVPRGFLCFSFFQGHGTICHHLLKKIKILGKTNQAVGSFHPGKSILVLLVVGFPTGIRNNQLVRFGTEVNPWDFPTSLCSVSSEHEWKLLEYQSGTKAWVLAEGTPIISRSHLIRTKLHFGQQHVHWLPWESHYHDRVGILRLSGSKILLHFSGLPCVFGTSQPSALPFFFQMLIAVTIPTMTTRKLKMTFKKHFTKCKGLLLHTETSRRQGQNVNRVLSEPVCSQTRTEIHLRLLLPTLAFQTICGSRKPVCQVWSKWQTAIYWGEKRAATCNEKEQDPASTPITT